MKSFYSLDVEERVAIANRSIAEKETVIERWAALELEQTSPWNERAASAGPLLHGCKSVADLGCGTMALENYLPAGVGYVPVDIVARDQRTLVIDFNKTALPDFGTDAVACLGLIEYIFDVPSFLRQACLSYRVAVVSYNPTDVPGAETNRRQHIWVNDYTVGQLQSLFSATGFRIDSETQIGKQFVWRLSSQSLEPKIETV